MKIINGEVHYEVGDKVVCINEGSGLIKGHYYTIRRETHRIYDSEKLFINSVGEDGMTHDSFQSRVTMVSECHKCVYECKALEKCGLFTERERK